MIELLAPAGSREALVAAVESGADAVYLAGNMFGARAYADNFDEEGMREAIRFAHLRGVHVHVTVNTIMDSRELPELKSSNFNMRSFGERVALNMPIQGTAADIMKLAMVRVERRLAREGLAAQLIMQVHDELIVECPEEEKEKVEHLLAEEMSGVVQLSVPLPAEAHSGKTWLEAKG